MIKRTPRQELKHVPMDVNHARKYRYSAPSGYQRDKSKDVPTIFRGTETKEIMIDLDDRTNVRSIRKIDGNH